MMILLCILSQGWPKVAAMMALDADFSARRERLNEC